MNLKFLNKRGVLMAICAAFVGFCVAFLSLTLLLWLVRPFVWAAIYGVPYPQSTDPYDHNSGEWLFIQGIGFLSFAATGFASAKWSKPNSHWVWISLAAVFCVLSLLNLPIGITTARAAIYILEGSLGIVFGAYIYMRTQRRSSAALQT
jgi:hypothetical protein